MTTHYTRRLDGGEKPALTCCQHVAQQANPEKHDRQKTYKANENNRFYHF